jgi:sn-glycerol 3-phosphate transport system ATP-binding protein
MSLIELQGITKSYGKNPPIIKDMDLSIAGGGFTILLGPSGCGKSTILRIIAGLEGINGGSVKIGGYDMSGIEPGDRGVAMVFQNYALYPTMTVRENIEFGLKNLKIPKAERNARIEESARMVGLESFLGRKPKSLSGGQRQRVALARAIVKKTGIFLMDEPLSNLDAKLRAQIRTDLIELHRKLGITFVYVTHDQVEAMSMGTEIILLESGAVRQQAAPPELYDTPANLFAARFIGSPPMNVIEANILGMAGLPPTARHVGFRPEKTMLVRAAQPLPHGAVRVRGELTAREMLGDRIVCKVKTDNCCIYAKTSDERLAEYGEVTVAAQREHLHFFDGDEQRIKDVV